MRWTTNIGLSDIGRYFLENTKLRRIHGSGFLWNPIHSEKELDEIIAKDRERLQYLEVTDLPSFDLDSDTQSLTDALYKRRSRREFSNKPLSALSLSKLLYFTCGKTNSNKSRRGVEYILRTSPSAGGLNSVDLYIYSNNICGLDQCAYFYDSVTLSLKKFPNSYLDCSVANHLFVDTKAFLHCSCVLIFTANFKNLEFKYGQRGYRYAFLDAGHMAQNSQLIAESLDLATFCSCGFYDKKINELIGVDGINDSVIYVAYIGTRV